MSVHSCTSFGILCHHFLSTVLVVIPIQMLNDPVHAGGQKEAEEAYEEAVNAIFVLQVKCHRHSQPRSLKIGKVRWEMIEMWPMQVSYIMLLCSPRTQTP